MIKATADRPSSSAAGSPPADERPVAILVDGVVKEYPKHSYLDFWLRRRPGAVTRALDDINFRARQGETLGLLGPNGAGKTTLLKILSTSLRPTSGRVLLHDRDIARDPKAARGMLGLVTCDERSFYWRLSGRRNLLFFAALYQVPEKTAERRIDELLDALGLSAAADRPFHGYSSGMKQKLAIARGLLPDPEIVLYDEPTRSLDPLSASNIRSWLIENRKRNPTKTHLLATNQLNEAEQLCDRVLIINHGRLIAEGPVAEIRRAWAGDALRIHRLTYRGGPAPGRLTETLDHPIAVETAEGDLVTIAVDSQGRPDALSDTISAVLAGGGRVVSCRSEEASFDEIFCSMVAVPRNSADTEASR